MPAKKKPKQKRFKRYIRGKIQERLDLGTLAANTLVSVDMTGVVEERTLVSSIKATWSLHDFTPAAGDGPIIVGVAHSDYTDAEIEAFLEDSGSWSEGNKIEQEINRRKVRVVGSIAPLTSPTVYMSLQDGKMINTKLNWILTTGQTLSVWAYNAGDSALASTDPDVSVTGYANLWPR